MLIEGPSNVTNIHTQLQLSIPLSRCKPGTSRIQKEKKIHRTKHFFVSSQKRLKA
jgi:hypothetical protein